MRWYEGGIADAVSLSRKNGSIFVVYVEGKDDKSIKLTNIINKDDVTNELQGGNFVAIKIEANSVSHQQFSEIYKQVTVPSVFFIGKSGTPLEIIVDVKDDNEFLEKVDIVLMKNGTPNSRKTTNQSKSSSFIANEKKGDMICENGVCTIKPSTEASTSSRIPEIDKPERERIEIENDNAQVEVELTPEQKVEHARELIEEKREAKRIEEEEKEKNKEIERRKMGQDVQKLKRLQHDQELKSLMEEREKEKKEQQAARQRILAQIEQDKVDRAARFSSNSHSPSLSPNVTVQPLPRPAVNTNVSRLQFKLPDGSSHTHEFSSEATLLEVMDYVKSNVNLPFNNFVLATTFPKHEFTDTELSKTLLELELVPNAVLLVLPLTHGTVATNPSSFTSYFWYLIAPIMNMFTFLKSMVFGAPKASGSSTNKDNKRPADPSGEKSRPLPKRRSGETSVIHRQGNVHRLTDKTDSDDDNNTWNGNSTQQM